MNIHDYLFRLNVISGGQKKIQKFNEQHPQRFIQKLYRAGLMIYDVVVGIPKIKAIEKKNSL